MKKLSKLFEEVWELRYKKYHDSYMYNLLEKMWIDGYRASETGEHLHPTEKRIKG